MSVPKKLSQLLGITCIVFLLAFLHNLNTRDISPAIRGSERYKENVLRPPTKPPIDRAHKQPVPPSHSLSVEFSHGKPRASNSNYTQVMVITRLRNDNISWIERELPGINTVMYVANEPTATLHPPVNKGHEVMIYLTYIIDHYFHLPDVIIFMHAHRWTHHNIELLGFDSAAMVRRLSNDYVARNGYVNMRCRWHPGCPKWLTPDSSPDDTPDIVGKQEEVVLSQCWHELFPSEPLPETLSQGCCAQFAVSKDRVISIPLSRFVFYRDWMLKTPLNDYVSGRIWEYLWQYLFTGNAVYCPSENVCHCEGFGVCFGSENEYGEFEELRHLKESYAAELKELRELREQQELGYKVLDNNNTTNTDPWESGRYANLTEQIEKLDVEMKARTQKAIQRGENVDTRADRSNEP